MFAFGSLILTHRYSGWIVFVDGLSDKEIIDKHIMKLLMDDFSDEYKMNLLMWRDCFKRIY